uniref:Uncharacterized protein n=1 Tax=Oryzias latipes TaxID=8090 RepID=A0A3B3I1T2_ORYLA
MLENIKAEKSQQPQTTSSTETTRPQVSQQPDRPELCPATHDVTESSIEKTAGMKHETGLKVLVSDLPELESSTSVRPELKCFLAATEASVKSGLTICSSTEEDLETVRTQDPKRAVQGQRGHVSGFRPVRRLTFPDSAALLSAAAFWWNPSVGSRNVTRSVCSYV